MFKDALRDLALSGVQWELSEISTALPQNTDATHMDKQTPSVGAGRVSSVVPPIAPVQSISLDTVRSMASRPTDIASLNRMIQEFNHHILCGFPSKY